MNKYIHSTQRNNISVQLSRQKKASQKRVNLIDDLGDCACSAPSLPPDEGPLINLNFINRKRELEQINNPRPDMQVIVAPAGYGKTALLKIIREKFEGDGWKCAYVDLAACENAADVRNLIAEQVGAAQIKAKFKEADAELESMLASAGKILLLLDAVEGSESDALDWLLESLSVWGAGLAGAEIRAIFTGRYTHKNDNGDKFPNLLSRHCITLPPFSLDVIRQAIEDTIKKYPPKKQNRKISEDAFLFWTKYIMRLSGGHPKSILNLLTALVAKDWGVVFSPAREQELFKKYVAPELEEIMTSLDEVTKNSLEVLSVFRFFSGSTIKILQKKEKLPANRDARMILSDVLNMGFVSKPKNHLFYSDKIVRLLLVAQMRITDSENYRGLNRMAQEIYDEWITSGLVSRHSFSSIDISELLQILVLEGIYHCGQQLPTMTTIQFAGHLKRYSDTLIQVLGEDENDPNYRKWFEKEMSSDEEIRTSLKDHDVPIKILLDLAFSSYKTITLPKGDLEMSVDPSLITAITGAAALLVEITRDVFNYRAQHRTKKEADTTESQQSTVLPIEQPDELKSILQQMDLLAQKTKIDDINTIVNVLSQRKRTWNDYREEEAKPNASARVRIEAKQGREDEEIEIKELSQSLKQKLEEITGQTVELPELE
ncbi:MAG: hypothetical protein QTN59_01105 [Candidatus Electrothrix communis]|nr:MAG: hypothetical protein QTN59_01105 [Candidatus Electrothrix communis]